MTDISLSFLENIWETLSSRLKKLRKERGWSQQDLAAAADVHVDTLRNYEQKRRDPQLTEVKKLADAFGISIGEMLGEKPFIKSQDENKLPSVPREVALDALDLAARLCESAGIPFPREIFQQLSKQDAK